MKSLEQKIEDLEYEYLNATFSTCCSCHKNPPCDFCVSGYPIPMDEFVELRLAEDLPPVVVDQSEADYDRAMKGIGF